jgi:hypothetical protein
MAAFDEADLSGESPRTLFGPAGASSLFPGAASTSADASADETRSFLADLFPTAADDADTSLFGPTKPPHSPSNPPADSPVPMLARSHANPTVNPPIVPIAKSGWVKVVIQYRQFLPFSDMVIETVTAVVLIAICAALIAVSFLVRAIPSRADASPEIM